MLKPGLKIPDINSKDLFDNIIENKSEKYRIMLLRLRSLVLQCYLDYEENKHELEEIKESRIINESDKNVLKNCYFRNKNSYIGQEIVEKIINIQNVPYVSNCPHCGFQITPDTIDHYLPKNKFPEFSILPINLIPMCGKCNNVKGENWIEGENRLTINYYFDEMTKNRFLYAKLVYSDGILQNVKFYLKKPRQMNDYEFNIVSNHFITYELKKRYMKSSATPLSVIRSIVKQKLKYMPVDMIKKILKEQVMVKKDIFGENYWEACLYEACLESEDFWFSIEAEFD